MALNNASELIKELEAEIEKEGGDPEGLRVPPKEEEDAPAKQERNEPEPEEGEQGGEENENKETAEEKPGAVSDEELESLLSSDKPSERRKGNAWSHLRNEAKEALAKAEIANKERQDLAERLARLEGLEEGRTGGTTKQDTQVEQEPDRVMYPDDWNQWKIRTMEKRMDELAGTARQAQVYTTYQAEKNGAQVLERQYKAANPKEDVDGAAAFLMAREKEGMKLLRPDMSDAQIDSKLEADKLVLYRTLHGQGRDPVDVVVKLAKAQGFKPGMAGGKEVPAKTNLEKLADNQRRSTNLMGGSPAGKPKGKLSTDDVFNMAFTDLLKMPKSARDALNEGDE